ncbi:MAG: hypothetical protein LLG20_18770 [Acidobacteriales bacterium]|nr:hypothetical protein [Terriglobales bacterium]
MTRRALFALPALAACRAAESPIAIQWHEINTPQPVDLPGASGAYTKYGILASVASDNPNAEAYIVTLRYWRPSTCTFVEQTKPVLRCRDAVVGMVWTPLAFYTGEPIKVVEIRARELVGSGVEGCVKGA